MIFMSCPEPKTYYILALKYTVPFSLPTCHGQQKLV